MSTLGPPGPPLPGAAEALLKKRGQSIGPVKQCLGGSLRKQEAAVVLRGKRSPRGL